MSEIERFDVLVFGSGAGGKLTAWVSAKEGLRTAVVERGLVGGSCPNIACLPTKNVIHSAKVADFVRHDRDFGSGTAPALAGTDFSANWKDETVSSLFERIRATMPADNPGSLQRPQVADLVAFILNFNKYPAGQTELATDSEVLKGIKITAVK